MFFWQVGRAFKTNVKGLIVLVGLWLVALAVGGYIVAHQRIHLPAWVPVVGQENFVITAPIASAAGVLPGQGQAVTVAGVRVGDIASVDLQDGNAVLRLRIKPEYAHVYPNATVLLRPKTGVKDMIAELEPGDASAGKELSDGDSLSISQTEPDVNFEEILSVLDLDTRQQLQLLIGNGGQAVGTGGGRDLASTFRRFQPLSRNVAKATRLVAQRHVRLKRLMGNLSKIATELGHRDTDLARFVTGSEGVFRRFARQNDRLDEMIQLLPPSLASSNRALSKVDVLGRTLEQTTRELDPTARALAPAQRALRPFARTTTPILRDSLRPFARAAIPTAKLLVPAARDFAAATPNLGVLADVLNSIMDELAYDPPGKGVGEQSTLFYVPWANHNTNSVLANQDGIGPIRRSMVVFSCGQLDLVDSFTHPPRGKTELRNPTLGTLISLLNPPDKDQLVAQGKCPAPETRTAGADGK
ncbi:MAG: MlaD family protein [Solirubrobacteraceae bacterium]